MADKKIILSFDDNDKPAPKPPTKWERANTPMVDIRGNNPTSKAATEQFQKDNPILGGAGNAILDTVSSMTSPLSMGLGLVTGGAGLLDKFGAKGASAGLHNLFRVGGAGMAAHGGYKAVTGKTPYEKAGGVIEGTLGLLGAHGGAEVPKTGSDYTTPSGLRVAVDSLKKQPLGTGIYDLPEYQARIAKGEKFNVAPVTSDKVKMHQAIDAHTLQRPKGAIAQEISGDLGRPEVGTKDPTTGQRVPRGLSIIDAEKAYNAAQDHLSKEARGESAVERAKGALPAVTQSEMEAKRPILDLIKESKTRNLTPTERDQIRLEVHKYPKGVVSQAIENSNKLETTIRKSEDVAQRLSNSDAAANIDVKIGQEAKLNEDLKNQAAATKPMDKATAKAGEKANKDLSKGNTPENRDTQNLADVEAWAKKRSDAKVAQSQAEAQQSQIDNFIDRPDVAASQPSASMSAKGVGPDGENLSLRQSYHVVPPDPKTPAGEGPGGANSPLIDPPAATKGIKGRKAAQAVADALGGSDVVDLKFNVKDGLHYVVPKGGSLPETPVMAPSLERDAIALKRFTNGGEAATMAKHTGGIVRQDGPRQYRVEFPDEAPATESTDQPTLPETTPIQEWSNGGAAPLAQKYPSLNRGHEFVNQPSTPQPVPRTPKELRDIAAMDARSRAVRGEPTIGADVTDYTQGDTPTLDVEPPDTHIPEDGGDDSFSPTELEAQPKQVKGADGKMYTITPGDAKSSVGPTGKAAADLANGKTMAHDLEGVTPTLESELMDKLGGASPTPDVRDSSPLAVGKVGRTRPSAVQRFNSGVDKILGATPEPTPQPETTPFVNPQGESEPTLPGVEPTVNPPVAPVADAPFGLAPQARPQTSAQPDLFAQATAPAQPQAFDWPEAGGSFAPNEAGSHVVTPTPAPAAPIRLFKSPLEHLNDPNVGYPATQAALKAGEVPTSDPFYPTDSRGRQVNPARQQGALKAQLGKPTQAPTPDPIQLDHDAQAAAVQSEINDPATPPLHREMLKRWLNDHGISLFPKDTPGGSIVSSFGAGQGSQFKNAFKNTLGGGGEQGTLDQAGSFLGNLRRNTLLNPYSVGKKVIGDGQSLVTGAMHYPERAGDILKNLFSQNTIDNFKAGWDAPNPSGEEGFGHEVFQSKSNPLSYSGRMMSGATSATKNILMDSGFTPEEAKALTLTKTPSRAGTKDLYEFFSKPDTIQNHLNPFSRIAANWLESGYEHSPLGMFDLLNKDLSPTERSMVMRKSAIGTGAGVAAYGATPDDFVKDHPVMSRMMTAGPVGAPILFGMALKNATKDDSMPFGKAVGSLVDELPGMQTANDIYSIKDSGLIGPARNYLSSYTNVARPIAEAFDQKPNSDSPFDPQERDLYSKDLTDFEKTTNKSIANIPGWRNTLPLKPDKKPSIKVTF